MLLLPACRGTTGPAQAATPVVSSLNGVDRAVAPQARLKPRLRSCAYPDPIFNVHEPGSSSVQDKARTPVDTWARLAIDAIGCLP